MTRGMREVRSTPSIHSNESIFELSGHILFMKTTLAMEILFVTGPIHKMPYSHGSFFGAAPFMLANPHWIDVLRLLMPDVYIDKQLLS